MSFLPTGVGPWKSDQAIKKSKSDFVAEYPIWVSIKRYLTGKLALAYQNWIYCIRFVENVQKPFKTECFRIQLFLDVFGRFLLNVGSKFNSDKLTRQIPLDRHPYWVFCDKVRFWLLNKCITNLIPINNAKYSLFDLTCTLIT